MRQAVTYTHDELLAQGWSLAALLEEAARVEASQFDHPYSAADFGALLDAPGGFCILLFPSSDVAPTRAIGVTAGKALAGRDGTLAHWLVTIAIAAGLTGQGLGALLDARCERVARAVPSRYALRILRSRAPGSFVRAHTNRDGGSPHGEATRSALKYGFTVMAFEQAQNFFGATPTQTVTADVDLERQTLYDCLLVRAESEPPWYYIPMQKAL